MSSWATPYIAQLAEGRTVQFRPRGNSMVGKVPSGALVTVEPVTESTDIQQGDVVLCKVKGKQYLHLVVAVRHGQFCIGNMHGFINGWTPRKNIFGRLTAVEN